MAMRPAPNPDVTSTPDDHPMIPDSAGRCYRPRPPFRQVVAARAASLGADSLQKGYQARGADAILAKAADVDLQIKD